MLAIFGGGGPIRVGADEGEAGIAASEKPKKPMRSGSILDAAGDAPSMKSISRLMSVGLSTKAERKRLTSKVVSPGCLIAATTFTATASASAVS